MNELDAPGETSSTAKAIAGLTLLFTTALAGAVFLALLGLAGLWFAFVVVAVVVIYGGFHLCFAVLPRCSGGLGGWI